MAVQPSWRWQWLSLIFPALKQEFTSIAQPVHLSKLNFSTFLVPKHNCATSTGPPRKWKWLYLIFPALKQDSMSIVQPLQLWKFYLWTFFVVKHACTTYTTVKTALSDLLGTETGVHKHCTTSTLGITEFWHIPDSETWLHNLHRTTTTVKTTLSDLPSTEAAVYKHRTTSIVGKIGLSDIPGTERRLYNLHDNQNGFIWSSKHWNRCLRAAKNLYRCGNWTFKTFLVMKDACTTSTMVTMFLSDLPSTETGVHKHHTTTTFVETES